MTEEQIKQNAEEYADKFVSRCFCGEWKDVVLNFTAGALSRDEEIGRMNTTIRLYANQIAQLRKEIEQLRNPWISVEDRLPEKAKGLYEFEEDVQHKMVLFKTTNGKLFRGYLDAEGMWRAFTVPYKGACLIGSLTWAKVTHWMPIPELKKGE